jgi:uncharacterized protein YhbP (UPF0306 family)
MTHPNGHVKTTEVTTSDYKPGTEYFTGNNAFSAANSERYDSIGNTTFNNLNMNPNRSDPRIDADKMTSIANTHGITLSDIANMGDGAQINAQLLEKAYAQQAGKLYNGEYLVVRVTKYDSHVNITGGEFHDKVMFIVEEDATLSAKNFYTFNENSSALVYVGPNGGKIEQLGSNGLFRGFIYIDENNTQKHNINFDNNSRIEGAIHNFSKQDFRWNTGSQNAVVIEYDPDVMSDFATLKVGADNNSNKAVITFDSSIVKLKPLGYYFY